MMFGASSGNWKLCAGFVLSAVSVHLQSWASPWLFLLQPPYWSQLLCDRLWLTRLGTSADTATHKLPFSRHLFLILICFAKYASSHTLFLFFFLYLAFSFSPRLLSSIHPWMLRFWFQDEQIWLAWGLGLCLSPFKELLGVRVCLLPACVCWCVKRMLMQGWSWAIQLLWRWQSRGHIVWASALSSTDGRREKEAEICRRRQKERPAVYFPSSPLLTSFSIGAPQIQ